MNYAREHKNYTEKSNTRKRERANEESSEKR